MKILHTKHGIFGLSKPTDRHWICMSCRVAEKETLTPLYDPGDGDPEPDGDSLCIDCAIKVTTKKRSGLEKWVSMSVNDVTETFQEAK